LQLVLCFDYLCHQFRRSGKAHPFALPAGRDRQSDGQVALACACFTYSRTVDSPTTISGFSHRNRVQMRCAVCRCLRGALRSASSIASMNGTAGASFGRTRSGLLRSGGIALAKARRTSRR
jgi:hypothetical protein